MSKNANYTSEFKREAVKLSQSAGKPSSQVAMELGVKPNTLYNYLSSTKKIV
jgi:transposase-like protein